MLDKSFNKKLAIPLFTSAIICALFAHGMALFNKYSYHDDVAHFNDIGNTIESGRWMLSVFDKIVSSFFGGRHISIPLINGTATILFITLSVYLILNELQISRKIFCITSVGLLVSFPAITEIFAYMYTAPYYYLGTLLGVLGACVFHRKRSVITFFVCTLLMACSTGVYQSNISVCICTLVLFMLHDVYSSAFDWKSYFLNALINVAICFFFFLEYLAIDFSFIIITNIGPTNYRGIASLGITTPVGYWHRVLSAYKEFFCPPCNEFRSMYIGNARYYYMLFIASVIAVSIFLLIKIAKTDKKKAVGMIILLFVFPISANFAHIMVGASEVMGRMAFGESFVFILAVWLNNTSEIVKKARALSILTILTMCILLVCNIKLANECYLKANVLQSQAISYYTTLRSNIISTEGYTADTPVVFINVDKKSYDTISGTNYLFDRITLEPYAMNSAINTYSWKELMSYWCGFYPRYGNEKDFSYNIEVEKMPCYPNSGSIRIIDGSLVVKFAETEHET